METIKYGSLFYLRHQSGKYIVHTEQGKHNWPKLGNGKDRVVFQVRGGEEGAVVTNGNTITIQSLENSIGGKNILGAFADSYDCYYWDDWYGENHDQQGWGIQKRAGSDELIHYEEAVYLINLRYNQQLVTNSLHAGYITTKNKNEWWALEQVE